MALQALRRSLSSWADSTHQEARDLMAAHVERTGTSIAEAPDRTIVQLQGVLRTVTLRPRGGVAALEAELDDGSGRVTLIWLGRRRITGVDPGRAMRVRGRIGTHEGVRVIFNPRYELIP